MMPKYLPLLIALALLASARSAPLRAEPVSFGADPASAKLGVASYKLERTGKSVHVEMADGKGAAMANLEIEFDEPEGTVFTLSKGKTTLRLTWKSQAGMVTVTDMRSGAKVNRTMALASPHATTTTGSVELLAKYDKEIALAFTALDQTTANLGLYQFFFAPKPKPVTPDPKLNYCPGTCTGPYVDSDLITAGSRTRCCEIARNNVNGNCSNIYCIGCCRFIGCDAACALGDFACFCQSHGQACGPDPFGCDQQTWPPTCT